MNLNSKEYIYFFIFYFWITKKPSMVKPLGLSIGTQTSMNLNLKECISYDMKYIEIAKIMLTFAYFLFLILKFSLNKFQ